MNLTKSGKSILAGALMAAMAAVPAPAQDVPPSHLQAARDAIAAIDATRAYDAILPRVAEALKARLIQNNPDLEQEILDFVDEETLALAVRRGDLERESAMIYASVFTEEDLRAIAEFYQTEAGQALIRNGALVARQTGEAALIWERGIERDLLENVSSRLREAGLREAPAEAGDTEAAQ